MTATPPPDPGWYPDPAGQQRYWDGNQWGPPAPPGAAAERRFTIHYGFALLAFFSLVGTLFFGIPMIARADENHIAGNLGIAWLFWGGMWTVIWTAFAVQHTLRGRRR